MLRERLTYLLNGETWVPFEVTLDAVMDFEAQDDLGLIMGPELYLNPSSTVSLSINTETPMFGDKDFRLSFELANEEKGWDRWITYIVRIAGGSGRCHGPFRHPHVVACGPG